MMRIKQILLSVLLALIIMPAVPAAAFSDYGNIYDATDMLDTDYVNYAADDLIPSFVNRFGFDLRVDIVDDLESYDIQEYARLFYDKYGYGYGENYDGMHLLIYVSPDENGLALNDYAFYYGGSGVDPLSLYTREDLFAGMRASLTAEAWSGDLQADQEACDLAIDYFICGAEQLLTAVNWEPAAPVGSSPENGADGEGEAGLYHITDAAALLTGDEASQLEAKAQAISEEYKCSIYIITLDDYADIDPSGLFEAGQQIYTDYSLGWGSDKDGIMLILSMEDRDYYLIAHGALANAAFTDYGKEVLAQDYFLDDFRDNSWYSGFDDYLNGCAAFLKDAASGHPVDNYGGGSSSSEDDDNPLGTVLLIVVIATIIAFAVCGSLRKKMKSVAIKTNAQEFIAQNGVDLTVNEDNFSHITQTRVLIKTDDSSSGGGTTVNSGGFSGSGGKF